MRKTYLLVAMIFWCATAPETRGELIQERFNPFIRWNDNTDYYGYGLIDWQTASPSEKQSWIRHCLTVDKTNMHPYEPGWVCLHFAVQTYVNFGGYDGELPPKYSDPQWSTPNAFNLPVYVVAAASDNFGHSINAILTGGNPLDFSDWFFFEPQTDGPVHPGEWNMPRQTRVMLHYVEGLSDQGYMDQRLITWEIQDDLEPILLWHDPRLIVPEPAALSLLLGAFVLIGLRGIGRLRHGWCRPAEACARSSTV